MKVGIYIIFYLYMYFVLVDRSLHILLDIRFRLKGMTYDGKALYTNKLSWHVYVYINLNILIIHIIKNNNINLYST